MVNDDPNWKTSSVKEFAFVHSLGITITAATFVFDLMVPLGVAAALPYVLLVLLSLRSSGYGLTWFAGISTTVLTVAGLFLSPAGGELWKVLTNRGLSLLVIWMTVYLVLQQKRTAIQQDRDRAALVQAEKMASLGEMAAGISHELGNPLAAIQGRVEILDDKVRSNRIEHQEILDYSKIIQDLTERMIRIIRGMRSLARDASSDPFQSASIQRIIEDAVGFSQERFKALNIDVTVNPVDGELNVPCRESQVGQVLVNLLSNSSDAIRDLPERWIHVEVIEWPDRVEVAVEDSGKGVPKEIRERILEPFFTTKDVGQGTGLGLSISQSIIESHDGELWLDATCRHTRFVFSIPKRHEVSA